MKILQHQLAIHNIIAKYMVFTLLMHSCYMIWLYGLYVILYDVTLGYIGLSDFDKGKEYAQRQINMSKHTSKVLAL